MPRRANTDHIVVGPTPATGKCLHCGQELHLGLPMNINVWVAATKAFVKAHRECPVPLAEQPAFVELGDAERA